MRCLLPQPQIGQCDFRFLWQTVITCADETTERAYVEARYSKHYKITEEELAWLADCVERLIEVVDAVCAGGIDEGG